MATPFDASPLALTGSLSFAMQMVSAPNNAAAVWKVKVESNNASSAIEIEITTSTEGKAPVVGQWQTYTFPLKQLADAGLDLSAIDVVMIFPAWGSGEGAVYRVDDVKIAAPVKSLVLARFSWGKSISRAPLGLLAGGRS